MSSNPRPSGGWDGTQPTTTVALAAPDIPPEAIRLRDEWREDPAKFCFDVFEQKPREFQPEYLELIAHGGTNRFAAAACRKAGKTALAAYAAHWWICTNPFSLVVTTAPTERQVKRALWVEIRKLWAQSKLPKLFPGWVVLHKEIQTNYPNWRAFGFASNKPGDYAEGPHGLSTMVIYDEAKAVPRAVYESLQGLLTDRWREIAISTPGGPNGWFWEAFTKKRRLWTTRTIRSDQIPRLLPKYEAEKERLGESNPIFRRQQMAEFAGDTGGTLIPLHLVEAAAGRGIAKGQGWKKVMGVDPAGLGKDETVVTRRYGPVVLGQEKWSATDPMETVGRIVRLFKTFGPESIVVDNPGMGSVIVSRLREVLPPEKVLAFNPGARALDDETYSNLKTECAFGLQQRFQSGMISIPDDPDLIGQLASWTLADTSRGQTKLVDPPDSPDRADSMLISFASEFVGPSVATANIAGL